MITTTRISSAGELAALEPQWSALVDKDPHSTPFHRPEWLLPWWRRFGSGEMHALAFQCDTRLVGLLGMFIHEWMDRRQVTLMGNGITDYLGLIAEPGAETECARLAFEYLRDHRDEWDVCDWQDLEHDAPLLGGLACCPTICFRVESSLPCTRTELTVTADEYKDSLPHGLRRTIRLAERRLARQGELRFETVTHDPEGVAMRNLFDLHQSRWATKGGSGSMLDRVEVQQFLIEASREFSERDKLRLYTMHHGGEPAATICALLDKGKAWGYITGMDPALSRYSPGSLVLDYAIGEAIRERALTWEFLRGDENYKFLWGAKIVPKFRLWVWHSSPDPRGPGQEISDPVLA